MPAVAKFSADTGLVGDRLAGGKVRVCTACFGVEMTSLLAFVRGAHCLRLRNSDRDREGADGSDRCTEA